MPTYANIEGAQRETMEWDVNIEGARRSLSYIYANIDGAQKEIFVRRKKLSELNVGDEFYVQESGVNEPYRLARKTSGSSYLCYRRFLTPNQVTLGNIYDKDGGSYINPNIDTILSAWHTDYFDEYTRQNLILTSIQACRRPNPLSISLSWDTLQRYCYLGHTNDFNTLTAANRIGYTRAAPSTAVEHCFMNQSDGITIARWYYISTAGALTTTSGKYSFYDGELVYNRVRIWLNFNPEYLVETP